MNTYASLVKDTVLYLKQERILDKEQKPFSPPAPLQKKTPPLMTEPKPKVAPSLLKEKPLPKEKKEPPPLLFDPIRKHLPHVRLIEAIPAMQQVAIICENEEDLPFLSNLAKAIRSRFFPVHIVREKPTDSYVLILSRAPIEGIETKKQILFEPAATYENQLERKKNLWNTICLHLSSKSS